MERLGGRDEEKSRKKTHLVPVRKSLDLLDCREFSRLCGPHESDVSCTRSGSFRSAWQSLNERKENDDRRKRRKDAPLVPLPKLSPILHSPNSLCSLLPSPPSTPFSFLFFNTSTTSTGGSPSRAA
jgi:hypothetical protein